MPDRKGNKSFALNERTLQLQAWNRAPPEAAGSFSGKHFSVRTNVFGVESLFGFLSCTGLSRTAG